MAFFEELQIYRRPDATALQAIHAINTLLHYLAYTQSQSESLYTDISKFGDCGMLHVSVFCIAE
jgi:hypothetical protein